MMTILISTVIDNFGKAMSLMAQGMTGIFIFMFLFYLLIYALQKIFKEKQV